MRDPPVLESVGFLPLRHGVLRDEIRFGKEWGSFDHGWTRINTDGENRRWVPKAEEAFVTGGWWKLPVSM
jgi:hypothetical protein